MSETRDLTKAQFDAACKRRGFTPHGFLGYYDIGHDTSVSVLNIGHNCRARRRAQLAYLIRESVRAEQSYHRRRAAYDAATTTTSK